MKLLTLHRDGAAPRRLPAITLGVCTLSLLACAVGVLTGCAHKEVMAADQSVPVRLRTPNLVHGPVSVSASGSVEADITSSAAFQVGGRVARVAVEEGQFVKQGQTLAELDCADYRNAYDAAAGQAAAAAASALEAGNGPRTQELEQARVAFDRAQDEYKRMQFLYEHQSLPANDFHKVEATFLDAQQRYDMARQGTRAEQKTAAAARANASGAEMQEARKHLGDCRLAAPVTGFIGMRQVDVGNTVAAGSPVFTVLDLDPVKVRVGIPEAQIGAVHEGARAVVSIPSLDGRQFEGKVDTVGVAADSASRTFAVKIAVPNPQHLLRAGMVSESRIYGSKIVDALTVPVDAVVHDPRGVPLVYVYDASRSRVFARRVELGDLVGTEVAVRSGLEPGDRVVVAGEHNVHEGSEVTVAEIEGGAR